VAIDYKNIEKMKLLVEDAKKLGKIVPYDKAIEDSPPEGFWYKDEDGKITVKEF